VRLYLLAALAAFSIGCDDTSPDAPQYYERVIQPIFTASCVRQQGGCHKDDGTGNALGNLDLTSYANVTKRRDVLRTYGSYPVPLLLLKASGAAVPPIPYQGRTDRTPDKPAVFLPSEIQHVGGATISVESNAFFELQQWMSNGAQEDGSVVQRPQQMGTGACRMDFASVRPDVAAQLSTVDTTTQAFKDFAANVEPVITQNCAFGTCHSAEQSDFFLTCRGSGSDDATKFNFLEAQAFVASPPETSQIVLKPLSPLAGGFTHTGGVFFTSKDDTTWKNLFMWASEVGPSAALANLSDGQKFFNNNVMPIFLKRGCAVEACHSPGSANDFKLRAGSRGFISPFSLADNYEFARRNFLVADVPDVRQSRIVKKPIISAPEGGLGLVHRGGPPLQTPGEVLDPAMCPQPWTEMSTPFCTMVEWHRIERAALIAKGQADPMNAGDTLPLVTVVRPPDADRLIDFDTYRPGADLVMANVTVNALGVIDPASVGAGASLLGNCPGTPATRDVRGPDASYDATKVAFAMRLSQVGTLDIYEVTLDAGHTCTKVVDGADMSMNGILMHNLDPMYGPDGSLVFASTRGRPGIGPTRSLKYLLPQTDLWRLPRVNNAYGPAQQMTSLLGSELAPAMMLNGQISFTAEKASADFYQLSGRRINWDLTDYHPLLGQRSMSRALDGSMHPSVGYGQATEIREGVDRNFVLIFSDDGCKGAGGALGIFNRSIGPFEADRNDITFLHSVTILDGAATGRAGPTQGAYRSPFPLPDGRILASYAPGVTDLAAAPSVQYDLVVVDSVTGARTPVANFGGGMSHVEPILVYKREQRPVFNNLTQLVFGGHADPSGDLAHAVVHFPDLPMLSTLLGANLRSGRFVDEFRVAKKVVLYEDQAPPSDLASAMAGQTGTQKVYQNRKTLGSADLASDGSVQLRLPSLTPVILELQDGSGKPVFTMSEEDQLGPAEYISRGVPQQFFNSVCAGCHGSVAGRELDIAIDPDALTGASVSLSRDQSKRTVVGP
jgi:hypothetical protein